MEITREIKELYEGLSTVNLDFLEFVEKHPESLQHTNFKLLELDDNLFKLQPWPTFINNKTGDAFREAGEGLFELIKGIPGRVFNFDPQKMSDYYGVPVKEIKNQLDGATEDHINNLLGRGDFILSPTGPKCLEYNVGASLGGWQIPIWESLYLNHPVISGFLKDYGVKTRNENLLRLFLEHAVRSTLSKIPGCDKEINIVIVFEGYQDGSGGSTSHYLDQMLKEIVHHKNKDMKGSVSVSDYPHFHLKDHSLFLKEKRIHVLVEMYLGYVSPEVMEAFKAGNIRLLNGPISYLLSNKLNLALLSDPETARVFTQEEKKIIDAYVPWTRKITPGGTTYKNEKIDDLERFMLSDKERLVIKPSQGLGGKGICVGARSDMNEWEKVVAAALKDKNWLVQELVESEPGIYQSGEKGYELHDMVWGFFLFGTRYAGVWNRVMPRRGSKGVINCHSGATVSMVFAVEEGTPGPVAHAEVETGNNLQMTEEMKEITGKLSRVNLDFLEFVEKNAEALNRASFGTLELNDRYYGLQPWPTFISRRRKEEFFSVAANVCTLIKSIPARLFDNDPGKISAYFGIPVNLVKIQMEGVTPDHMNNLVGRGDFIYTSTGLKCLEFNVTANVSGWQLPEWEALYLKTPLIERFLGEYRVQINNDNFMGSFLEHIIESSAHLVSGPRGSGGSELNAAMVAGGFGSMSENENPMQVYLDGLYREKLKTRSLKGNVYICDHKYLEFDHDKVYLKGKRIHAITELQHGLVPPGVIKAFTAGNLRLMNGPVTGLLSNKFCLALLSENEDTGLFSAEEKKNLKAAIPWTRKIIPGETTYSGEKIKMESFLIDNRDRLVIKPAMGLGGEGVYVGQGTPAEQWEMLVKTAIEKRNALVQELVDAPPAMYQVGESGCAPHDTVWGTWIFGPRYGGSFVRARPKTGPRKVVNAYTGALISIVFETEE